MIKTIRSMARAGLRSAGEKIVAPLVVNLSRRPQGEEIPVSVHMLVSSKTWRMGLLAVLSLEIFSGRPWRLFIHEDGSVGPLERSLIEKKLPGVRFVPRPEAEDVSARFWQEQPACRRNRSRHNLFLKFLDPVAFAPGDKFLILDADLFFYKKPAELLEWALGPDRVCFYNRDVKEVYCQSRRDIEQALGIRLWENFNSGLVGVCKEAIDLNLSENLLTKFESTAPHPQFFEQTLYALNCSAFGKGGPLPPTYQITWDIFRRRDSVCRHYVGPAKNDHLYFEGPATLFCLMTIPQIFGKNHSAI
jgi:hypothetical protein